MLTAVIIGGLAPSLLQELPQVKALDTLPCVAFVLLAFLGGPLLSVWIYKRLSGGLTAHEALTVGVAAGIAASVPGVVVALGRLVEAPRQLESYPPYLPIPGWFAVSFGVLLAFLRAIVAPILGSLAGLIGRAVFVTRPPNIRSVP